MHDYRGFQITISCLVKSSKGMTVFLHLINVSGDLCVKKCPAILSCFAFPLNMLSRLDWQIHASRQCGCSACRNSTWICPWAIFPSASLARARDTRASSVLSILLDDTRRWRRTQQRSKLALDRIYWQDLYSRLAQNR